MNEEFKKYFGNNQSLKFVDIKCDNDHGSEEANIMMKYDANQDKYVYNDNHPGHGGYGDFIGKKMVLDSIEKTEKGYNLVAKVLEDYKKQLDTYTFIFVKEDGRLIFNSYSIDVTPMKSIKKDS